MTDLRDHDGAIQVIMIAEIRTWESLLAQKGPSGSARRPPPISTVS
jgi:hypothetical protein